MLSFYVSCRTCFYFAMLSMYVIKWYWYPGCIVGEFVPGRVYIPHLDFRHLLLEADCLTLPVKKIRSWKCCGWPERDIRTSRDGIWTPKTYPEHRTAEGILGQLALLLKTNKQTNERTNNYCTQTNQQTNKPFYPNKPTNKPTNKQTNKQTNKAERDSAVSVQKSWGDLRGPFAGFQG